MRMVIVDDVLPNAMLFKISVMKVRMVEPIVFSKPKEALEWCRKNQADIMLVDHEMPEMTGIKLIEELRRLPHMSDVPIIMVTAHDDSKLMSESLRVGADDFVVKPVDDIVLQARTRTFIKQRKASKELSDKTKSLRNLMYADTLTGLKSRSAILTELESSRQTAQLAGVLVSVIGIDIDNMHAINRMHGYDIGDDVLRNVSKLVQDFSGPKAECGRIGSDEFLIVGTGLSPEQALLFSKRIQSSCESLSVDGRSETLNIKLGIAITSIRPDDVSINTILNRLTEGIIDCRKTERSTLEAP